MVLGLDGGMKEKSSHPCSPRQRTAALALRLPRFMAHAVPWGEGRTGLRPETRQEGAALLDLPPGARPLDRDPGSVEP